jgi:hypothetical protein
MLQVDYKLVGTGWCMVDAIVYGTGWCMVDALVYGTGLLEVEVQVDAWFRLLVQVVWYKLIGTCCLVQVDWYMFTAIYLTVIV